MSNPLLIKKRKFDIRSYAVLTSINGNLKGYVYEEGYLRTAASKFSLENLDDPYAHLTNEAIQKNGKDFGKFEQSNKLTYEDL